MPVDLSVVTPETSQKETRLLSIGMFFLLALSIIPALFYREPWLWMDEVLSYIFLSDPSLAHMNGAVVSSMDANPPLFLNLYWLMGHAISLDPLFLRIVSVLFFAGTMTLLFWYTTRLLGNPVTNFVLLSAMVYLTYQNFAHATEIRSYAIMLPISCGYFIIIHQLINRPGSRRLLVGHTLVGMLLAFCHNYGLFYLAASGAFFGLLLLWSKQRSYGLVLASYLIIGLAWLVMWFPSFTVQAQAGQPHSWIPLPTVTSFFKAISDLMPSLMVSSRLDRMFSVAWLPMLTVCVVVGLFLYLAVPRLKAGFEAMRQDEAFSFFLLAGFVYLTTILIALTVSLTYTSIFLTRYMWPSQLLIMFQLVYIYHYFVRKRQLLPRLNWLVPIYSILLGGVMFYKVWKMQSPFPSRILDYLPQLSGNYPVFVEQADYYLPIWFHKQRPDVEFLLDWETANSPGNIRNATVDFKILQSMKEKYNVASIIPVAQFNAATFPHFYVVDEQNVYQIEDFIKRGRVRVVREFPIAMSGHRLLECSF